MNEQRTRLFNAMQKGATLITPNNRLSHQLLHDYYLAQDTSCVDKPRCLAYPTFLRDLFQQLRHLKSHTVHPLLLTKQQIRLLWHRIIENSRGFSCNEGLLNAVIKAWTSCEDWQLDYTHPAFQATAQTQQFQQWQHTLQQRLTALHAITEQQLINYFITQQDFCPQGPFLWVSFDDYTPAQRALQQTFEERGCQQLYDDFSHKPPTPYVLEAHELDHEYQHLMHWIKTKHDSGEHRIGVVVPDLDKKSNHLYRLLTRHVPKESINLSLGQALVDFPLVAHALQWLQLEPTNITHHQLRLLLHSPYLGSAQSEFVSRAQFMQDSPLLQKTVITFEHLKKTLAHSLPALKKQLDTLISYPTQADVRDWIACFKKRLTGLGFPGEGPLDSATYQCLQRFIMLFDELRQLAVIQPIMTQEEALHALSDLAKTTIFQPQTKQQAPIQVLGLLEATGCTFDSLWVTSMTDQCLPEKNHFSAFIPIVLQHELNMPHAQSTRELTFATSMIRRLQQGCCTPTHFSFARLVDDNPCMPSSLIRHYPRLESHIIMAPTHTLNLLSRSEHYHYPLMPTERTPGGTALLANQAQCPFRAFAAHRLHAKAPPATYDGLNTMERGQIVHRVLELVWQTLKTQDTLFNYSSEELDAFIQVNVMHALTPFIEHHVLSFPHLIQSIEIKRITRLVHACLAWEKTRPPFTVEALEHAATFELAGLTLHVKLDRIDITSSGKWVIDYKSSLPTTKPWLDARPEAPQLLLYALLDEQIKGLLFIELKQGRITPCGFSAEKTPLQGIRALDTQERWEDHQAAWREQLSALANEFKTGHCPPVPTKNSTCQTCEFQNLCRIHTHD